MTPEVFSPPVPGTDAGLQQTLAGLQWKDHRRLAIVGLVLVALPAAWFVRTDLQMYPQDHAALLARIAVRAAMVLIPLLGIVLLRTARTGEEFSRRLFGVTFSLALVWLGLNALRPAGSGLPLRSPLSWLAILYVALPNSRWRQIGPPLLLTAGLLVLETTWLRVPGRDLLGDLMIFAVLNAVGVIAVSRRLAVEAEVERVVLREREARMEAEAAMTELRTLRGIIPICFHCKHVRTDLGDWQQVEQYVEERSAAEFSHGVCPKCLQKYYANLAGAKGAGS